MNLLPPKLSNRISTEITNLSKAALSAYKKNKETNMPISFNKENDKLICAFSGRMDTVSCMEIKDEMKEKIEGYEGSVVFDMNEVDYISSSFLRICAQVSTNVSNENFSIINVTPNIKKVFMMAGLADKFNIE